MEHADVPCQSLANGRWHFQTTPCAVFRHAEQGGQLVAARPSPPVPGAPQQPRHNKNGKRHVALTRLVERNARKLAAIPGANWFLHALRHSLFPLPSSQTQTKKLKLIGCQLSELPNQVLHKSAVQKKGLTVPWVWSTSQGLKETEAKVPKGTTSMSHGGFVLRAAQIWPWHQKINAFGVILVEPALLVLAALGLLPEANHRSHPLPPPCPPLSP